MPRRDALSEEKRKRLMQEHEQLQKLMLQARSSVRRSSMKDETQRETIPPETVINIDEEPDAKLVIPVVAQEKSREEVKPEKREQLTENELFQTPISSSRKEKQPLTEVDLFKEQNNNRTTAEEPPRSSTIHVIWPKQNEVDSDVEAKDRDAVERVGQPTGIEERLVAEDSRPADEEWITFNNNIEKKRNRRKVATYTLLLIILLVAGFGGYYLYQTNQNKHTTSIAKRSEAPVSTPIPPTATNTPTDSVQPKNINENKTVVAQRINTEAQKEVAKKNTTVPVTKSSVVVEKKANEPITTPNMNLGKYKVISKAYFHNEADENTRRKAFMTHWDNALLTPLDEKNGFVYIIFTNHLGQTSKGWLRKSDLQHVE